jgi:uncharacterized membrane protein
MAKYPKLLSSSANENNLSLTIKGLLVALVPLIIAILRGFGVDMAEIEVTSVIDAIFGVVASVMILFGLARKLYYKYFNKS